MITRVTEENKGLYKALFEKAQAAMWGTDITDDHSITCLDDYFCVIEDLIEKSDIYQVLPLDEPYFEIDANTRVITVPTAFKNNGISVKGDQIAEIVYFSIDRYFDTTDLYDDSVKIYIQWEAPNGDQGLYPAILRDISILQSQGKMLFGWTIDNNITKNAGTMKFSVRFLKFNGNDIVFSLSTLTANAIVNPGLDFQWDGTTSAVEIIDNTTLVRNRFQNSEPTDDSTTAPNPSFLTNIPTATEIANGYSITITDINASDYGKTYYCIDLDSDNTHTFIAQATSTEGIISYTWKKATIANGINGDVITGNETYYEAVPEGSVYTANVPYYENTSTTSVPAYELVTISQDQIGQTITDELYVKKDKIIVTGIGNYWVVAKNRKGKAQSTLDSNYVRIPGPGTLGVSIGNSLVAGDDEYYQVRLAEGAYSIPVTGSTDRLNQTNGEKDLITYTWVELDADGNVKTDPAISQSDANKANGTVSTLAGSVEEDDRAALDLRVQLKVKASRNGADTSDIVKKFRITDVAHAPVVVAQKQEITISGSQSATLQLTITDPAVKGVYSYQWYKLDADNEEADVAIDGATSATYTTDEAGLYYCLVTNTVNGSSATNVAPQYNVEADRAKYTSVQIVE